MRAVGGTKKPVLKELVLPILQSLVNTDAAAQGPGLRTRVTLHFLSRVWVDSLLGYPRATRTVLNVS